MRSHRRGPSGACFLVTTWLMVSPTAKTLFAGSRSSMTPVVSERIAHQSSATCVQCLPD